MTPLFTYYGDDFTGSTDVMEALAGHGVNTVLFTRIPSAEEFAPFAAYQAFGLAGSSRSQTPAWMDAHLPAAFAWLKSLNAQFLHYKVCSTFDSSPSIGSIGRAVDIGARVFEQAVVPLVVGAPQLKRYTFAGHLFAGYQGQTYRIDRHPVMRNHPVTPMHEADLCVHLAAQTDMPVALANTDWPERGVGLLDVYDLQSQLSAGHRLLQFTEPFVVGSSGVEYAVVKALAETKRIAGTATFAPLQAVKNLLVVSGSVSPTTERQIKYSLSNGFAGVSLDPVALARGDISVTTNTIATALAHISEGKSVVIHTALGPATDVGEGLHAIPQGRQRIGEGLGQILRQILSRTGLRRAVIAGGDSSSHALAQLDVHALTTRFPLTATPGSPLCTAHSKVAALNGVEIAMKGGQVGGDDYFVVLRDGIA